MNPRSFGLVLLSAVISLGGIGKGQIQTKPSTPAADASSKNPFDSFKTFSATLNGGMGQDHDRKIYRSGSLMRLDFGESYRITDLEKHMTWGVDPHSCAQIAMPDAGTFPFSAFRDFKVERSLTTENETVDGHICAIEKVTFTPNDSRPFVIKMKLWEAADLAHFPIKIEVEPSGPMVKVGSNLSITYTNVNLNRPDASLFKHPSKCTPGSQPGQKETLPLSPPATPPKPPHKPQP